VEARSPIMQLYKEVLFIWIPRQQVLQALSSKITMEITAALFTSLVSRPCSFSIAKGLALVHNLKAVSYMLLRLQVSRQLLSKSMQRALSQRILITRMLTLVVMVACST